MVRNEGVEPPCLAALGSKPSVSANSTNCASDEKTFYCCKQKLFKKQKKTADFLSRSTDQAICIANQAFLLPKHQKSAKNLQNSWLTAEVCDYRGMSLMKLLSFFSLMVLAQKGLALNILYIGDSHSYIASLNPSADMARFGNVFLQKLESEGHQVSYYAACGSEPEDWARGSSTTCGYSAKDNGQFKSSLSSTFPPLHTIYKPIHDLLVINLGDNMFDWVKTNGKTTASLNMIDFNKKMNFFLDQLPSISESNCRWIGPTYHIEGRLYKKSDAAVDQLYTAFATTLHGKCQLIDSRSIIVTTTPGDGLHHTATDSRAWAAGILQLF